MRFRVLEERGEDVLVELDGWTTAVMALATTGRCARRIAGEA